MVRRQVTQRTVLYALIGAIAVAVALLLPARESCGPFPDSKNSAYVLPYPVGSAYRLSQGNCSSGGHSGDYKYAYDFAMPIGTTVTAIRGGVVAEIRMKFRDGQRGEAESNWLKVRHSDGTLAVYSHLTANGALVKIGDAVERGQPIALSGDSGNTGGIPHLHLHLSSCSEPVDCGTLPFTFSNAEAASDVLLPLHVYPALPLSSMGHP